MFLFAQDATQVASPDSWEKYGLPGLVIFACFGIIWYLVKTVPTKFEDMSKTHHSHIETMRKDHMKTMTAVRTENSALLSEIRKEHREERQEWVQTVGDKLTEAVHAIENRNTKEG